MPLEGSARRIRHGSEALICLAIVAQGAFTVCGWILHSQAMVGFISGNVPMVFNTGLCFMVTGIALWLLPRPDLSSRRIRTALGGFLVVLGALVLTESAMDQSLGVDLASLQAWFDYSDTRAGRMAPNTSIGFLLLGAVILLADRAATKRQAVAVVVLTLCIFLVGLTGLAAYALTPDLLFEGTRAARMAIPTAAGLILSAIALRLITFENERYTSVKFFREDETIRLVGPGMLLAVALTAGLSGFVLLQSAVEKILTNQLESVLQDRVALFTNSVEQDVQHAFIAARLAHIEDAGRRVLASAGTEADIRAFDAGAGQILAAGVRGIALEDGTGTVVHAFGKQSLLPALTAPLNAAGSSDLLWDGELILRTRLPVLQSGGRIGEIVMDQSAASLDRVLFDAERLGKTGELAACILRKAELLCFPASRHAAPFNVDERPDSSQPLPMQLAIAGQWGYVLAVDYRHQNVIAAYGSLAPNFGIVVKQDTAEMYGVMRDALRFGVPFIGAIALLGALLLHFQLKPLVARMLASEVKANESERQLRILVGSVGEGIVALDEQGVIRDVNPALCEIFGYESRELLGKDAAMLLPPAGRPAHHGKLNQESSGWVTGLAGQRNMKASGVRKNGSEFPFELTINEMKSPGGRSYVGVLRDITERNEAERRLTALGQYDSLTDLPNRSLFLERLSLAALRMARSKSSIALLYLDLDGFKAVNDNFGHQGGDELLVQFALRLSATVRKTDTVARLAGDEFTIILEGLTNPHADAMLMAQKIIACVQKPFSVGGRAVTVSASVGIAVHEPGDVNTADFLARADKAMYAAKRAGKNRACSA